MSTSKSQASENQQIERFQGIRVREKNLNQGVIGYQTQLKMAEETLVDVSARSKKECGTDDIDELGRQYKANHSKNDEIIEEWDQKVTDGEKILAAIKAQLEQI
jgi:hypothetical protein